MKRLIIIGLLFLLAGSFRPVSAIEKEAGEAAKLASGAAVVSDKKPDPRIKILEQYLISVDSPMASHAAIFIRESDTNKLDWRLVPAIAGLESSFGKHIPSGSYNPFGWGIFTGKSNGTEFKNWEDAISSVSKGLKEKYVDNGLVSVEQIGFRYAASTTWAPRIRFFMNQFDQNAISDKNSELLGMTL